MNSTICNVSEHNNTRISYINHDIQRQKTREVHPTIISENIEKPI